MNEREVFVQALDIDDASARSAYLDRACGTDAVFRERIEVLLKFHGEEHRFLEQPIGDPDATALPEHVNEGPGSVIGRYKLLEEIGEGGFGVVYMAEQYEPVRRRVALKIIKLGMDTRQIVGRFEAERQALAMMDHPNIARIIDGGSTDSGRPYFAMELVKGIPITQFCDENKLSTRERLQLFRQVCDAVQHAHQKGIIHRDLKATNILVTMHDDKPVTKIIDFGIAKATQHRLTEKTVFTRFQQFIGTPAYMSPEQATFTGLDVDTRSDIYSLGVLLYELLTGTTPFDVARLRDAAYEEICRTIREEIPPLPSARISTLGGKLEKVSSQRSTEPRLLGRTIRGELDWIVMKALEKDRSRRYETAAGLATDIDRFMNDEPVLAGPPSVVYRLQKFVRRNRVAVVCGGLLAAALVAGACALTVGLVIFIGLRNDAEVARKQAEGQEWIARQISYVSDMNLAMQALRANNLRRVRDAVERQRPVAGAKDLRGWEWRFLWQYCQSDALYPITTKRGFIHCVSFSRDGRRIAIGSLDGVTEIWQVHPPVHIAALPRESQWAAFSPREDVLATASRDGDLTLWNASTLQPIRAVKTGMALRDLTFSGDGSYLAAIAADGEARVWEGTTGNELHFEQGLSDEPATRINFGPDSRRLAIGRGDGRVRVVELPLGQSRDFNPHSSPVTSLVFSPDGTRLLSTSAEETAITISDITMDLFETLSPLKDHRAVVHCMAFRPNAGTQGILASAGADATIRLWDVNNPRPLARLQGHLSQVLSLGFSPDGQFLVSGDKDGVVNVWDLARRGNELPARVFPRVLAKQSAPTPDRDSRFPIHIKGRHLSFRHDGKQLAYLDGRGGVVYVDLTSWEQHPEPGLGTANQGLLCLSDDRLVVADHSQRWKVWDHRDRRLVRDVHIPVPLGVPVRFIAGDDRLVTFQQSDSDNAAVKLTQWNVRSWTEVFSLTLRGRAAAIDVSPDASTALIAHDNDVLTLWSDPFQPHPAELGRHLRVTDVAFSPNGTRAATCGEDGAARLWDIKRQTEIATLHGHSGPIYSVAFSPDGGRLATGGSGDEAVKLWDLSAADQADAMIKIREVACLEGAGTSMTVEFSPDGRTLVAYSAEGNLHIWRAPSLNEIDRLERGRQASLLVNNPKMAWSN